MQDRLTELNDVLEDIYKVFGPKLGWRVSKELTTSRESKAFPTQLLIALNLVDDRGDEYISKLLTKYSEILPYVPCDKIYATLYATQVRHVGLTGDWYFTDKLYERPADLITKRGTSTIFPGGY